MTIEEFLLARIREVEHAADMMVPLIDQLLYKQIFELCANQRKMIDWHKNWPVLVESPPKYEHGPQKGSTDWQISVTQQMAWLTQEAYVKQFGSQPPTAPLLKEMADMYRTHPDWREVWH
jgi:hypothetical protein